METTKGYIGLNGSLFEDCVKSRVFLFVLLLRM